MVVAECQRICGTVVMIVGVKAAYRVLPAAVDHMVGGGLASVSSGLICRALFPAAIPQKTLIYDIPSVDKKCRFHSAASKEGSPANVG